MNRFWLLTNSCYGTWLPGDERGFVGRVWEHRPGDPDAPRVAHAEQFSRIDREIPGLEAAAKSRLRGDPIRLDSARAASLLVQFRETASFRKWTLRAVAIMSNHFHIVVGVPGDPDPAKILGDFKSWGTRRLNAEFGVPASGTWWTQSGSKRRLDAARAV